MDCWTSWHGNPGFQTLCDMEDMEDFRSEKSVQSGKSAEEIEKFFIDEKMSDLERTYLLLTTGQDTQKLCVIEQLPDLLRHHQMDTMCRIIPKLCDMLPSSSVAVQVMASQILSDVIQQKLIPIHMFITSCLPTILKQLESRDQETSRAWLGTVLACIPVLPKDELKRKILTLAVSKGQLSQTISSRQNSCRIVGEIALRFSSESMWMKCEVLPLATTLCQDVDSSVRQLMCRQLPVLARALGCELAEESILPELIELINDEEAQVRVCALEALTELLNLWSEDCLSTRVLPLVKGFYETTAKSADWVLIEGVAKLLGKLCHGLKDTMTPEQLQWFMKFYIDLHCRQFPVAPSYHAPPPTSPAGAVLDPKIECRQLCAFNFPAMLLLVGKNGYKSKLSAVFEAMARDESWRVRKTIACGFHEVVNILEEKASLVIHIYQSLLKDLSVEVLSALVPHVSDTLLMFAEIGNLAPETRHPGLIEFISPLISCDQMLASHRQWRLHHKFMVACKCVGVCMTSDQIHAKFVPLMFKHITGKSVLPVKQAAIYTLCVFIRNIRRQHQKKDLILWIITELAKNTSCHKRLLFIDACHYLLDIFSRSFFKAHFFENLLELSHDPVVNIRMRLYHMFPTLKSILKLPADRVLLQHLETTVRKLITHEHDADAAESIRDAVLEMDRIEVAMETLSRKTYFEADLTDQQKELEERMLLEAEEKDKGKLDKDRSKQEKLNPAKKNVGKKINSSPREVRKLVSISESKSTAPSPGVTHRTTKEKVKPNPLSKTLSAPTSTVDLAQAHNSPIQSPAHNPAHNTPKTRRHYQSRDSKDSKDSPPIGDKVLASRNSSGASSGSGAESQSVKGVATKTKDSNTGGSMPSTMGKNHTPTKKKSGPHTYAVEYSGKGKKRTS